VFFGELTEILVSVNQIFEHFAFYYVQWNAITSAKEKNAQISLETASNHS
jgi:hypothetical protein